jgi:uncharacterized protein YjcR
MARPTKYQEAYAEQARKLCLLGYTDAELADFFEVSESTINKWKLDYPKFSESIKKGKAVHERREYAQAADAPLQQAASQLPMTYRYLDRLWQLCSDAPQ